MKGKLMLKYELSVNNFTCPECGAFSDEVSQISQNIMDDTIDVMCCDTEFWKYDLEQLGFTVKEIIHA